MDTTKARKQANRTTIIWLLIALLAVAGGTFAWFNFQTATNVDPGTGGTVSNGEATLLISNSKKGPFTDTCKLLLDSHGERLDPISTATLSSYYKAAAQDSAGISILYSNANNAVNMSTMHGRVYLKAEGGAINVYLYTNRMTFGKDIQAIAAMRLGLKIKDKKGTYTYIFNLDDMANTKSAEKRTTTAEKNVVVKSTTGGVPNYVKDGSLSLSDYSSIGKNAADMAPKEGKNKLFTLQSNDIAEVEYVLYLEGCDENCINSVQNKTVDFALSFAGNYAR